MPTWAATAWAVAGTVSRDHHDPDAEITQAPNHGLGVFPWRVMQGHQADEAQMALRPRCDSQNSTTLACQCLHVGVGKPVAIGQSRHHGGCALDDV